MLAPCWRRVALALLPIAGGCQGDLLPGERVLGEEIPAVILEGEAGSRLGASVAVGEVDGRVVVAVAAPDAGRVQVHDADGALLWQVQGEVGLGIGLAVAGGALFALAPGEGVVSLAAEGATLVQEGPQAAQLAVCADGSLRTTPDPDGAVACGPEGQDLRTRCEAGACEVELDGVVLDATTPGSAVGFDGDLACWGDADLDLDDAPGAVRCADGSERVGLQGEHLGRTLAQGYMAGVFDKWIVPARARVRPVQGGEVWAVDRAAEATRLSVAAGEGLVVVGVPGYASREAGEGRVYIVEGAADVAAADP